MLLYIPGVALLMWLYHVTYAVMGVRHVLSTSSDPNPINITERRLTADLYDVNGVDMEEADGVTLSSTSVVCSGHQSCSSVLHACILHRANTGRGLRMFLIYGNITVYTEYISNLLPIFNCYWLFLSSSGVK